VVKLVRKAGVGATLPVRLGGKLGPASGDPVDLEVKVHSLLQNYFHTNPQQSGAARQYPLGDVVALRHGGVDLVVASRRCQCFSPKIFSDLGIDPVLKHVLLVKSAQHFYNAFAEISCEIIYMSAPGAVPPDPRLVPYRHLDTESLYPWCDDPFLR
jgi:microcystin degradation protein MlrC